MKRTIVIESPVHLSQHLGQMVIQDADTMGKISSLPVEDLGYVIIENQQTSISNSLIVTFARCNVILIHCGTNKMPVSMTLPIQANTLFSKRLQQQVSAPLPLKKRLWQQIIKRKIHNQRRLLELRHIPCMRMKKWEMEVTTGDSLNHESRAAVFYWRNIFGDSSFIRDPDGKSPNHLLNYGYSILRAITARHLSGSGLHSSLGLFHKNKYNPYCLADDMMEPYRPFVDALVLSIMNKYPSITTLDKNIKSELLQLPTQDVRIDKKNYTLAEAVNRTTSSLADCFENKKRLLTLPDIFVR